MVQVVELDLYSGLDLLNAGLHVLDVDQDGLVLGFEMDAVRYYEVEPNAQGQMDVVLNEMPVPSVELVSVAGLTE